VDYSHYPDKSLQQEWLRAYLEAYKEHKGQGGPVTDREVEVLYVQVNRFTLVRGPEAQPQSLNPDMGHWLTILARHGPLVNDPSPTWSIG
jgi:hypothetical protein